MIIYFVVAAGFGYLVHSLTIYPPGLGRVIWPMLHGLLWPFWFLTAFVVFLSAFLKK
jgi:hypothetical protein